MKIILKLILFTVSFSLSSYTCDNFDKYRNAYNYIINDTLQIKSGGTYYEIDKSEIFISSEIVMLKRIFFTRDIAIFEHNLTDKMEISMMADSIFHIESEKKYKTYILDTLNSLNAYSKNKKFVLYFSEVINNQLSVELFYNYFDFMIPSYKQAIENAGSETTY